MATPGWGIKVLYDGGCPLCRREAAVMRRLDAGRGRVLLEDISSTSFCPGDYGISLEQAMGAIHGVLPDGRVVAGVEVFRRTYTQLGWGWLWAPTGWPLIRPLVDALYRWFARNRLSISAWFGPRTSSAESCDTDRCRV